MSDRKVWRLIVGGVVLLVLISVGAGWYRAGVQAEVYRRQGVEMSTWEVFTGAKPAERTIHVR